MSIEFYWAAVIAVTILSTARLARLAVLDKFPPVKNLRERYEDRTDGTDWQWLTMCAFCMAPWMAVLVFGSGLLIGVYPSTGPAAGGWTQVWWVFNGWLAISYLAGSYVARDGAKTEDD